MPPRISPGLNGMLMALGVVPLPPPKKEGTESDVIDMLREIAPTHLDPDEHIPTVDYSDAHDHQYHVIASVNGAIVDPIPFPDQEHIDMVGEFLDAYKFMGHLDCDDPPFVMIGIRDHRNRWWNGTRMVAEFNPNTCLFDRRKAVEIDRVLAARNKRTKNRFRFVIAPPEGT